MAYYPIPLHTQRLFDGRVKIFGSLKSAELAAEQVLSLPIDTLQTEKEATYVANMVKASFSIVKLPVSDQRFNESTKEINLNKREKNIEGRNIFE